MQEDEWRPIPRKIADMQAATITFHTMLGTCQQGVGWCLVQGPLPPKPKVTARIAIPRQRVSETGLTARENVTS
jgi:hypothetical protein